MGLGNIGITELLILLLIILLLFGARRIPEVMRSFGRGVSEFKRGLREVESDLMRENKGEGDRGPAAGEGTKSGEQGKGEK